MDNLASLQLISPEKIREVLDYPSLIIAVERGLANFSKGKTSGVVQPVRSVVTIPKNEGFLGCMPVYSQADDILVTKLVSFFPENKDTPTHSAIILVFSTETGVPKALLDGDVITGMRTAAASVVASKYLVNGEPRVLALLGSGFQARSHYAALSEVFKFHQVKIWNHRLAGAQKLAAEIGDKATALPTVEEAVKDADVIVTVTSAKDPVLKAEWVKPGTHINAVGACRPNWAEIDPELMRSAVVYADSLKGALQESGDVILSKAEVYAEIGEVVNGTKTAKRDQTTIFKSLGMAIEDGVAAKLVLRKLGI